MVVVALHCAAPVVAQDVRPAQTNPSIDDGGRTQDELPVSLDRIKRALDRPPPTDGHARLLDFTEFVVVVGTAPDVPLFEEGDFSGGPVGSMHAEMMAAVRPSRMDQAVGSDSLGVATAALFSLVPPAGRAIAGWFWGMRMWPALGPQAMHRCRMRPPGGLYAHRTTVTIRQYPRR